MPARSEISYIVHEDPEKLAKEADERRKRVRIYAAQIGAHRVTRRRFNFREIGNTARPVECVDTGQQYKSVGAAARSLGIKATNISQGIRKGCRAGGLRFRHVPGAPAVRCSNGRCLAVMCIDTGETFMSASDAARAHGLPIGSLCAAARRAKPILGRRYQYLQHASDNESLQENHRETNETAQCQ